MPAPSRAAGLRRPARTAAGARPPPGRDGSGGVPDRAPYDAIVVSAAFPEVPAPPAGQLRRGGRLVQPVGPDGREQVVSFLRTATGLERRRMLTPAHFVRLRGRYGFPS
ncbi:protein-L-isoaspartate O-methyltransferase [Streptomyces echinoruber]|uniref:protein-L-isoaspartate O-methyltransferase family protein n=1 Tax=Streptomyces echinoruber TaxID=68898 RepID=UPI0036186861